MGSDALTIQQLFLILWLANETFPQKLEPKAKLALVGGKTYSVLGTAKKEKEKAFLRETFLVVRIAFQDAGSKKGYECLSNSVG